MNKTQKQKYIAGIKRLRRWYRANKRAAEFHRQVHADYVRNNTAVYDCAYCQKTFSRRGIGRHINHCEKHPLAAARRRIRKLEGDVFLLKKEIERLTKGKK